MQLNISARRHTQTPSCSFFPVLTDLNEPSHMNSSDSCQKEVFWLKLTISVYVICLLRLQSERALLASICQETTTVEWGIPQGGPKVWAVLLT